MYLYTGLQDPTRAVPGELDDDALRARIHALTDLAPNKTPLTVAVEPFSSVHPPKDVSFLNLGPLCF